MKHMQPFILRSDKKQGSLFVYLLILTAIFIVFEISFFIQCNQLYLGDFKLVSHHLQIPVAVLPGILSFAAVFFLLHFIFVLLLWILTRLVSVAFHFSWKTTEKLGFQLWVLGFITLLLANHYFYPNSKYSCLLDLVLSHSISTGLFCICLSILLCVFLVSIWGFLQIISQQFKIILGLLCLALLIGLNIHSSKSPAIYEAATAEKPNIILIGIDSLRPDYLGYFGFEKRTPHLDDFLNQSVVFANALTPIARTFPSWVSILSGRYPKNSQVRFNLASLEKVNLQNMLPSILHSYGYETVFATDETRFSNIDRQFGFDSIVTPPIGFNDFFVGTINDFPLTNLLVNTSLGKFLFPYSYGNRPVFAMYDPDSFLKLITTTLEKKHEKPLFLAIHFCLPHFPYSWKGNHVEESGTHNYQSSIVRVDQQVHDFLTLLHQNNLLKHAIVVLLSDHGEAMEMVGDRVTDPDLFVAGSTEKTKKISRFYPPSFDSETVNQSAGHGTDILGLVQYHSVLAFRSYGLNSFRNTVIPGLVSLMDIKPTLLDILNFKDMRSDGYSLKKIILGQASKASYYQDFFMETDFSPEAVRSVHPEMRKVLFEGIHFFEINPKTLRMTVKNSMADMIIQSKQYADIYQNWILALYPQSNNMMTPVLVNLNSGEWTLDLNSHFAKASPAKHMLISLKRFYGNEITHIMADDVIY